MAQQLSKSQEEEIVYGGNVEEILIKIAHWHDSAWTKTAALWTW